MNLATIKSNSITVRYEATKKDVISRIWDKKLAEKKQLNLHRCKSTFGLSYQSRKKLQDSISFLHSVSTPRTVQISSRSFIYNFQSSFVTLTLPSKQSHSDIALKSALNTFLTNMRQKFGLKNYVWKAELQRNENIHFHLVFDIYIHHKAIRYYWNLALENLGYISAYQKEWGGLSLQEYADKRGISIHKAISGFQNGVATKWRSPGTEQVTAIRSAAQLGYYVSKYLSKSLSGQSKKSKSGKPSVSISELVRIRHFGRTWGRSQSLSKITYITRYVWDDLKIFLTSAGSLQANFQVVVSDWCTRYFLKKTAIPKLKSWFSQKMRELAFTYQYSYP